MKIYFILGFFFPLLSQTIWEGEGTLMFKMEKYLYPSFHGKIQKIFIKKGDSVKKNQKIALIHSVQNEREKLHLNQSFDQFNDSMTKEKQSKDRETKIKSLEWERLNLQLEKKITEKKEIDKNWSLKKELFEENLISSQEWERASQEKEWSNKSIHQLKSELQFLESSNSPQWMERKNWFQESLQLANETSEDRYLRSPFTGFVLDIKKFEGEYASPNGGVNDSICFLVSQDKVLLFPLSEDMMLPRKNTRIQYSINDNWLDCTYQMNDQKLDPKSNKINHYCIIKSKDSFLPVGKSLKMRIVKL
jgi:multidrug efflux pump subunit AcrA (membrane-fusion protein)